MYVDGKLVFTDKEGLGHREYKPADQEENFVIGRNIGGSGAYYARFLMGQLVVFKQYLQSSGVLVVYRYYVNNRKCYIFYDYHLMNNIYKCIFTLRFTFTFIIPTLVHYI